MRATAPAGAGSSHAGAGRPETVQFPVSGMTCGSCVVRVTRALRHVAGVEGVRVDLGREVAIVRRVPGEASDIELARAVSDAGYEAHLEASVPADPRETAGPIGRLLRRLS